MSTMKNRLSTAVVPLLTLILFAAAPIDAVAQSTSSANSGLVSQIVSLTNEDRVAQGIGSLKESAALDAAAQKKANDMLAKQYFSHVAPDGSAPWKWFAQGDYSYVYAGENLAMNFYTASDVEAAW